jgi:hypothetical protein
MTELCSHIIDLVKEKASQTNSSVLYFFASSTTKAKSFTDFTHTLLHQIVCCSAGNADSIAATFLNTLPGGYFQRCTQAFMEDDSISTTIEKILDAPENVLIEALVKAIVNAGIQDLWIIVDGMSEDIVNLVVKHIMRATRKLKALFTIDESPTYGGIRDRLICIEYDKERKGLHIHYSVV